MAATNTLLGGSAAVAVGKPGQVHTVQLNPVGQRNFDVLGNEYIYLSGIASTLIDDLVTFNPITGVTARLVADAVGPVAIATAAIVASNWGWYQIYGTYATANSDTVAATVAPMFIDGTAGRCDDAIVTGDMIIGMNNTGADATNKCPVSLNYPYVSNSVG